LDNRFKTHQRLTSPIQADKGKHAMFDLVPLTRARRIMANRYFEVPLVAKPLQEIFPRPNTGPIASAPIGANQ
jgi:hypothetical protein